MVKRKQYAMETCRNTNQDVLISDLHYEDDELVVLTVMRYFFVSFTKPQTEAWIDAIQFSIAYFGFSTGSQVAANVLCILQTMRLSRQSCFHFQSPSCLCCKKFITPNERCLMNAFKFLRQGASETVNAYLMIVTEGNDHRCVLEELNKLRSILPIESAMQRV